MGTIQPSRFLSHTGKILPGVRRVIQIPEPAANAGWSVTVPAGVQWYIIECCGELTVTVNDNDWFLGVSVTVDGYQLQGYFPASGNTGLGTFSYVVAASLPVVFSGFLNDTVSIPVVDSYLPQGSLIQLEIGGSEYTMQLTSASMWIEEVYVTDPQLSEIARERAALEHDIAVWEYEQAASKQQGG